MLAAEVGDSRTRGDTLGADYRSQRLSLSQAWRPAVGNDSLDFHLDRSRLRARSGGEDTITALRATASRALAAALRSENQELPLGNIRTLEQDRVVQINARLKTPQDFADIVVQRKAGGQLEFVCYNLNQQTFKW